MNLDLLQLPESRKIHTSNNILTHRIYLTNIYRISYIKGMFEFHMVQESTKSLCGLRVAIRCILDFRTLSNIYYLHH